LSLIPPASAQTVSPSPAVQLDTFYVDERQSSFEQTVRDGITVFTFNMRVLDAFKQAQCVGPKGIRYIRDVLPVFKRNLERRKEHRLIDTVKNYDNYKYMILKGGNLFKNVFFTQDDVLTIRNTAPADFQLLQHYLVYCVGLDTPVFVYVITNPGPLKVVVDSIEYWVTKVFCTQRRSG
jgi:hypothetical protein